MLSVQMERRRKKRDRKKEERAENEKCKLYLKQAVELAQTGFWSIKEAASKKYNLGETKFTDFFTGDPPKFVESKAKKMPNALSPNGKKKEEKRQKKEERAENEKELKKQKKGRPALSLEEKEARKKQIM